MKNKIPAKIKTASLLVAILTAFLLGLTIGDKKGYKRASDRVFEAIENFSFFADYTIPDDLWFYPEDNRYAGETAHGKVILEQGLEILLEVAGLDY